MSFPIFHVLKCGGVSCGTPQQLADAADPHTARACLSAIGLLLDTAQKSVEGAAVTEGAKLFCLHALDNVWETFSHYLGGRNTPAARVADLARRVYRAMCKAVLDFKQSPGAPTEGWRGLGEIYRDTFGSNLYPVWAEEQQRVLSVDRNNQGGLVTVVEQSVPAEARDCPWHPQAWVHVCEALKAFDFGEIRRLFRELNEEAAPLAKDSALVTGSHKTAGETMSESLPGASLGFHVLLSHNSKDKPAVKRLKQWLVSQRLIVWYDEDELRPGIPWQQLLEKGIRSSESIAVLVGKDGIGPWENEEMQAALQLAVRDKRPVIPVLLPDAPTQPELPMFLHNRTWVDLRAGYSADGLDKLVWGITGNKSENEGKTGENGPGG